MERLFRLPALRREAIAILLGLMRSNVWITTLAMFAGKALRYVAVLYAVQGAISLL